MSPRFAQRLAEVSLIAIASAVLASVAVAQNGIMFNNALLMDDDLLTLLDTDTHGVLSAEEYSFYRNRLFDQNDADHNRSISAQEYADHAKAVFADMDADHDGMLTRDELVAAHADMLRMMYKNPHAVNLDALAGAMIDRMDSDHDGRISVQEYAAAMNTRFNELDENQSGGIDRVEFAAVHRQHKAEEPVK